MEKIIDKGYWRIDEYEIVTEWPWGGYVVWAIGRGNFPHPGYLPLAQPAQDEYHIRIDTLKALYVGDEALCLAALDEAVEHGCDESGFKKLQKNLLK
jgi:hypothetical protein